MRIQSSSDKYHKWLLQASDESYASYKAEKDGILASLARRAKVHHGSISHTPKCIVENTLKFVTAAFMITGIGDCIQ